MANELVRPKANECTLYELEDSLAAFVNTIDLAEDEPTRQLILDEIGQALRRTKEKRDAVVAFLRHCEQQQKFADAEIERIEKRQAFIARVQEQLERYVVQLVEQFAVADRRGIQRLEGNVSTIRIQKNPDSVIVTDLNAIPAAYKQVILAMPAYVWEALLIRVGHQDRKEFESRVDKQEFRPDKKVIAAELKKGIAIPGADLKFGDNRLVIS
jgi:hypothetical protein